MRLSSNLHDFDIIRESTGDTKVLNFVHILMEEASAGNIFENQEENLFLIDLLDQALKANQSQ